MWRKPVKIPKQIVRVSYRGLQQTNNDAIDYNYWQRSKIPTMHFQKSLPRLPIPKLELTCERYLAAQRPLLIEESYRKTEANVNRFRELCGNTLQTLLKEKDNKNKHTSYISEMWFDMYLRDRKPLPINYNPVIVFKNDERPAYNDQLIRTSNFIASSLRFYKSLTTSMLEPDVFHLNPKKSDTDAFRTVCSMMPASLSWYAAYLYKAYPLDMNQYPNLFHSTRIPEMDKDRLYCEKSRHVCVQFRGNFYAFNVLDENDNIITPGEIHSRVKQILDSKKPPADYPVGVLTTLNRNDWAMLRHELLDKGNESSLKKIDTAMFHICLDDAVMGEDKYKLVRNFLHGDGTNRWFDKSFSLQVSKDGYGAVNFEHSWGDGVAVLRYFQDIFKDSTENPRVHPESVAKGADSGSIKELDFNLNDHLRQAISEAMVNYKKTYERLNINYLLSEGLGKNLCKAKGVSPDAMMQLSFQSAYYKQRSTFVPTYESCSTAAFKHGRTETIRPCTMATRDYCLQVHSNTAPVSAAERYRLLRAASAQHMQLTREAAMGQGFDRHLYALRQLASHADGLGIGGAGHEANVFEDPAYAALQHNVLSTSTLSSPAIIAGAFGPVVEDGYGIGYVIRDNSIGTLATSYPVCDSKHFIECLEASVTEIVDALHSAKSN